MIFGTCNNWIISYTYARILKAHTQWVEFQSELLLSVNAVFE
jgi:hypothetical protein